MTTLDAVQDALTAHFGAPVTIRGHRAVGGGCINEAMVLDTSRGEIFVKTNGDPVPELFTAEAEGLRALRDSGTSLVVPEVLAWADPAPGRAGFLALSWLPRGRPGPDHDADFGRGLASLHRATSTAGFGFSMRTYCGTTPQPNAWAPDWVPFYRDARLGHQLRLGADRGLYDRDARRTFERLLARLEEHLGGDDEPPALIHGDLWSGNRHVTADGAPSILDPAASYAHREAELGMMTLFGGFSPRVFAAYEEAWPLPAGWRERNPVYELYHVMNHATLFGGGYAAQAVSIARRFA